MSTTIPTIKEAIKDRLQADGDLSSLQISRGSVLPTRTEGEYIEIGTARSGDEVPAGLGTDSKQESYMIEVVISVIRSARELYSTIEDRAFVIYGHVWDSIIDWRTEATPFSGIAGWMGITSKRSEEFFTADLKERECRITIEIEVNTRI